MPRPHQVSYEVVQNRKGSRLAQVLLLQQQRLDWFERSNIFCAISQLIRKHLTLLRCYHESDLCPR
eukprot:CCRYP_003018-RA/>CCRYP_003018-RA protein AED:0.36 eAED:0.52 QI:257/0/0.5/1/0/0/2/0/65